MLSPTSSSSYTRRQKKIHYSKINLEILLLSAWGTRTCFFFVILLLQLFFPEYGCSGVKTSRYHHPFTSEASSPPSTSDTVSKYSEMKIEREGSKLHWWGNRRRSSGLGTRHSSDGSAIHWSSSPQNTPTIKGTSTQEQKEPPKSKHKERK